MSAAGETPALPAGATRACSAVGVGQANPNAARQRSENEICTLPPARAYLRSEPAGSERMALRAVAMIIQLRDV